MVETSVSAQRGTAQRVRRSVLSMFIGKPISAVAGLLLLVLLSRHLDPIDYGSYFAVLAIAEILILASNLGLMPAAIRYLGAHQLATGELVPYGPVKTFVVLRTATLMLSAALLLFFSSFFEKLVGASALLPLLAIIFAGEGLARFVEIILDSMFCQGRSQFSVIFRTVSRLVGVSYLIVLGNIDLYQVVLVEAIVCGVGGVLSLLLLSSVYVQKRGFSVPDVENAPNPSRVLKFALPAFAAQVLGIAYGPDVMKLVLAGKAGEQALAAFGFSFSIVAVVQRYMPATLFAGIFRPVFVSAAKRTDGDQVLSDLVSISVKINWFLLFLIAIVVHVAGDQLLFRVSKGNYTNSGEVLFILVLMVAVVAVHLTLSMYSLAKEISMAPLYATALGVMSLPVGFLLAESMGATGIAISLLFGEVIWCVSCFFLLGHLARKRPAPDWRGLLFIVLSFLLVLFGADLLLPRLSLGSVLSVPLFSVAFLLFVFFFNVFSPRELVWISSAMPRSWVPGRGGS